MKGLAQALSQASQYAIVSQEVSKNGEAIGFLYREAAAFEQDSGWRFFSGWESDEYVADVAHFDTLPLSEVVAMQPEIKTLLNEQYGAWEWSDDVQDFVPAQDWQPQA